MGDFHFRAGPFRIFVFMRGWLFLMTLGCWIGLCGALQAQTLGGNAAFNFLKLPGSPQLTALGGVNVSVPSRDLSMAAMQPSLLRPEMHGQVFASFQTVFAGIQQLHAMGAYHHKPWATTFTAGVLYMNYGSAVQTDPAGNILGDFRPQDYSVYLSASRRYLNRWHYGATIRYIGSNYGVYRANAIALDVGISYQDTANLLQVGFVAKHMGAMIKSYSGNGEDLPFDLQLGITKRLAGAPLQFSLTAQRLHQFDILYRDTSFNADNFGSLGSNGFFAKLFRHFVFGAQGFIGDKVELSVGYNVLRRAELAVTNLSNGLTGFSYGVGVTLPRLQIRYAGSQYQNGSSLHQFGMNVSLAH
jgi:hypothetical protein